MRCTKCQTILRQSNIKKETIQKYTHFWFFDYETIKPIILDAKYRREFSHLKHIASQISLVYGQHLFPQDLGSINYVPTSKNRLARRGFDHAYVIAKEFSKALSLPIDANLTQAFDFHQTGYDRQMRLKAPKYIFTSHAKYSNYLLIDDVVTTGASSSKCALTLMESGAKSVTILSLSKVSR